MKLLHLHDGNRPSEPEEPFALFDDEATLPLGALTVAQIARELRGGATVHDRAFDRYLPHELRVVANRFWTPVVVAACVSAWVDDLALRTVVDLGSGAGKFCVVAALAGVAQYTGVEVRPRLVRAATELARTFGVEDRVRFAQGMLGDDAIPAADAYYLFNPFGENLFDEDDHLDDDVPFSEARYQRDVGSTQALLRAAPTGTCVFTYNGFGGSVPVLYEEIRSELSFPNPLRLFRKRAA